MPESGHKTPRSARSFLRLSRDGNHSGGHRGLRVLACALVALVGMSAVVYFAWPTSSARTAGDSTGVASLPAGQTAQAGTSARAGAADSQAGAPKPPVPPVALNPRNPTQVAAWNAGQGGAALAAISAHLSTALMAHGIGQFIEMRRACVSLVSDVKTASVQPPIPDATMQHLYKTALDSLAAGAANCKAAITSRPNGAEGSVIHTDPALLNMALSELNIGVRDLYNATAEIKALKQ
jgi:hypothetical protein